jgi:hypothetical protein
MSNHEHGHFTPCDGTKVIRGSEHQNKKTPRWISEAAETFETKKHENAKK